MKKLIFSIAFALTALVGMAVQRQSEEVKPKKPALMWIDASGNLERFNSADTIDKYVNRVADLGFTHLVVDARPIAGYLLYDSDLAPRFMGMREKVNLDPTLDYLGHFVEKGHERGLKVLFSLNVFCAGHNYHDKGLIYEGHPEWATIVQDPERGLVPITEQKSKYGAMVNPSNPEYQDYIIDVMKEMLRRYPEVDGLMLDRGRYDGISADFSDLSREQFEKFIGKKIKHFPKDILEIKRVDGKEKVVEGKYYKDWIYWRSKVIADFFARARAEVKSVDPDAVFATYSGAWYPSYYEVGVNFASKDYDASKDFPNWAREDYKTTGYAELLDMYATGNYYTDITVADYEKNPDPIWNETDFEGHSGDWYCVEGSCKHLRRILGDNKFLGGILVDQLYDDVSRIPESIAMNLNESDGLMVFDICHIINRDLWDEVRRGMALGGNLPAERNASMDIIPAPEHMTVDSSAAPFKLDSGVAVIAPDMAAESAIFKDFVEKLTAIRLGSDQSAARKIIFKVLADAPSPQYYQVTVNDKTIVAAGGSKEGVFTAAMMLVKAIGAGSAGAVEIPNFDLSGVPAYGYRGAHFDVSRHFFDVDDVKTFIDMLALHGINRFHWHLTDDQGWRLEIKKYPRLTEIGSRRDSTVIGRNSGRWDNVPVEGFYTQEQAREIVDYAKKRHIEIIPEIDMPGHMLAAMAAYPELGCAGGPYDVWTEWGITEKVLCPGNPKTMEFITDVLNEVMDIFPFDIIHIGGDECPKDLWKTCPKCQALIKQLGIKAKGRFSAEDILQGYVTRHAADVAAARGRRIIGWDEILESDIPADAIIMSWRGENGAKEGVERDHDVVLVPNDYLYFDYYQTKDVEHEPFAIGGFVPVEKVYKYDPARIVKRMDKSKAAHILGLQANLWTEYVPTFSHVQYMELPRMAALSEVQWTPSKKKDYKSFKRRIPAMLAIYDRLGYNYARHIIDVDVSYVPDSEAKALEIELDALPGTDIRYTLDGQDPEPESPLYAEPLLISRPAVVSFASFTDGRRGRVLRDTIHFTKASFHDVVLNTNPDEKYKFSGARVLTDGIHGTYNYRTGRWLGFFDEPFDATVDLGEPTEVAKVGFNACVFTCDSVVDAQDAEVLVSDDGKHFRSVAKWVNEPINEADEFTTKTHEIALSRPVTTRYVRLKVTPQQKLPAWHPLAGSKAFVFVDELIVR